MSKDPKKMSREEVMAKVLAVNPDMRRGEQSAKQMSEQLLDDIRASRGPRQFSDEKFETVFLGMLSELETKLDADRLRYEDERLEAEKRRERILQKYRDRIIDFVVSTYPGPIGEQTRAVLKEYDRLLRQLGTSITMLNQDIKQRSAVLEQDAAR